MSYTGFGEVQLVNKEGSSVTVLAPKGSTVAKGTAAAASSLPVPLLLGAVGLWLLLGRKKGGSQSWL